MHAMQGHHYTPERPILKRYLAEMENLRHAVFHCHAEFAKAGIPDYAICAAAGVSQVHLRTYLNHAYRDYAHDDDNYELHGNRIRVKNNHRYIPDESILRLCEYFRIEVVTTVTLNPRRYETMGELQARIAEENWRKRTHKGVGKERAQPNRPLVD